MMRLLGVVAILAAATISLSAQSRSEAPVQEGPTFKTGVEVIAVDVSVVDGRGKPIEDLLAPDFVIKIDGEPRRVVSAEHVKFDVEAARREAADPFETLYTTNLKPTNGRMIVIAVDQLGIRFGAARALLGSAANFLDRLSPADRVALIAYPDPGVQVPFTDDKLRLKNAMQRIGGRQQQHVGTYNIGIYEAIAIAKKADARILAQVVQRECARLVGSQLDECEREVASEAETLLRTIRQENAEALRGLYNMLLALSVIEGPKTLILVSEGMILESPSDLDIVVRAAAIARVTVNVLALDVPRHDVTVSRLAPTAVEDRDMQEQGLADLAASTRGSLYYVTGTGESIFDRLASEMLAFYLVAVEQAPSDRDGKQHRIDVEVRRRNVTVRSRRGFVLSTATTTRKTAEDTLLDALKSPFGVAEVPLRVTTFAQKDRDSDKTRLLIAAEVGQPGGEPEEYTVGHVLMDAEGKVVSGIVNKRVLSVPNGLQRSPRDYLSEVVVEPGNYNLRFGVVDATGRRGGIIREVNAWKLDGEEFALGDLLIGETGADGTRRIRPGVEPRISGNVGAFLEVYSTAPAVLDKTIVSFEIADDQDTPALVTSPAEVMAGAQPTWQTAQAVVSPALLPPGRYVARARVMRDGKIAGLLSRPFILESDGTLPMPFLRGSVAKFEPGVAIQPDLLRSMLDSVEKRSPALKGAVVEARAGRYGAAALEALTGGDDASAAFFKGLEWYTKGQLNEAATQFQVAAGPRREFFAAAFYLGAVFAAAGRDRDAAGVWQLAMGQEPRPTITYLLLADARMRDGQAASVIDVLKGAYERNPKNEEIGLRLAVAYLTTGRYAEALPAIDRYLVTHPTDAAALFAAVFAQYQAAVRERLSLSAAEQSKLARYVRAYQGPQAALLAKYLQILRIK